MTQYWETFYLVFTKLSKCLTKSLSHSLVGWNCWELLRHFHSLSTLAWTKLQKPSGHQNNLDLLLIDLGCPQSLFQQLHIRWFKISGPRISISKWKMFLFGKGIFEFWKSKGKLQTKGLETVWTHGFCWIERGFKISWLQWFYVDWYNWHCKRRQLRLW